MESDHQTSTFKYLFCTLSNLYEPQFYHLLIGDIPGRDVCKCPQYHSCLRSSEAFFFFKKATLKGHPDYLPTLIPGQRPNLFFKNPPKMESPKHHQSFQQLPVSSFAYVHPTYFSPATEFHQPSPQSITQIYQERSSFLRASLQQPCSLSFPGWTILFIIIPIFLPFIKILNFKMLSSFKSFS